MQVLDRILRPPVAEDKPYNAVRLYHLLNRGRAGRIQPKLAELHRQGQWLKMVEERRDNAETVRKMKEYIQLVEEYTGIDKLHWRADGEEDGKERPNEQEEEEERSEEGEEEERSEEGEEGGAR